MTRILKVRNVLSPRTPRDVSAASANAGSARFSGSFHDPAEKTRRTTSKRGIRRLMAKSPTDPLSRDLGQFTNNANPKFDPSKAPGSVSKTTSVQRMSVGSADRGHGKVIKPNRFSRIGGKTLKRKQF